MCLLFAGLIPAQDEGATPQIWRGEMMNLLTDPVVLLRFSGGGDGKSETLRAPIAVNFPTEKVSFCWDAVACRLVYVWKGDFLKNEPVSGISSPAGDPVFLASGPQMLSATVGAYGKPGFFGFKLIEGVPEFYYTCGRIGVREKISVSENGESLIQHFAVENAPGDVQIVLPEPWIEKIKSSKGTLKGRFLTLSKTESADFTLTYLLQVSPPLESEPKTPKDETPPQ